MSSSHDAVPAPLSSVPRRREFLKRSTIALGAIAVAPKVVTASRTRADMIVGEGPFQYKVDHQFLQLPSQYRWQTTHNVAVDSANRLYVIHEGIEAQKDHPSIFVFDDEGKFIRAFGSQYQGGGHGIEVRQEGGEEFLYVAAYQQVKAFSKLTLDGQEVWTKRAPREAKVYHAAEFESPKKEWGRDRFMPTNFAFLEDGGFLLADGYGAFYIHRYDKDANWVSSFGGPGAGEGKFETPHGIWIDDRDSAHRKIVVTDRAHGTLQIFDMEGKYLQTITGFGLPANVDRQGDLLLVPELSARVSILDREYRTLVQLGSDVERVSTVKGIREDEKLWEEGKFVHPHDACFDRNGNIIVAEWVRTGRVTRLTKLT
jgi:DNA-binding beta-propeller fold protein YncE